MTGGTVPPSAVSERHGLRTRALSAAVMVLLVVLAVWWGIWSFILLVSVLCGLMAWEWATLTGANRGERLAMTLCGFIVPAGGAGLGELVAIAVILLATLAVGLSGRLRGAPAPVLAAAGLPYLCASGIAAVWLRLDSDAGAAVLLWVVALVAATDTGAYFIGRAIGGPKLAPRISPNKTWAGLVGGACAATAVGLSIATATGAPLIQTGVLSLLLSLISQAGDLTESALKRRFGVKDSSNLIPGHGGFLDRLDGYLTALPAAALMRWGFGGGVGPWQ